jgi:carbonic anhydrase
MPAYDEILEANARYAEGFEYGTLPAAPARKFAVVTCMDARLDPAHFLGLREGDAHVIRNAGGLVTDDALRSLIISHWELGTAEAFVVAHTACGMLTISNEEMRRKLAERTGANAGAIDFLPISDLDESVRASVRRIMETPLLPPEYAAHGFVYDVTTGRLREVA